jgi:hypothetical protein
MQVAQIQVTVSLEWVTLQQRGGTTVRHFALHARDHQ